MSQWDTKGLAGQADAFRTLLRRLPGVYAAGPRFDENGTLSEIHVLASLARSPKQVVRDVQSAIFAAYGIEVDHRIVSVAQLPEPVCQRRGRARGRRDARGGASGKRALGRGGH